MLKRIKMFLVIFIVNSSSVTLYTRISILWKWRINSCICMQILAWWGVLNIHFI